MARFRRFAAALAARNLSITRTTSAPLAEHAQRLQKKGVHTLLSNHDTEFTQSAYHQADITSFDVQRMISCKVDNRAPVRELLALYSPR